MKRLSFILLCALLSAAASCVSQHPGGTEFGNPTQTIHGTVTPPQAPLGTTTTLLAPCGADTATAVDSEGQEQKVVLAADCGFSLTLPVDRGYVLLFSAKGLFVARLVVNSGDPFPLFTFFLSPGDKTIELGSVQLEKDRATPANSPLAQMDRDKDGLTDSADSDDDNDGVADAEEKDCDLDGFIDDDDGTSACSPLGAFQPVLQVSPFNGQTSVALIEPVRVRFGCAVNSALLDPADFVVQVSGASTFVPCSFTFPDPQTIECVHPPFTPNTNFEGVLGEIDCQDGSKTQPITWSWTTVP